MSDHSPAPWRWAPFDLPIEPTETGWIADANGEHVLSYTIDDDGLHISEADKALILAAPKMLRMLAVVEVLVDSICEAMKTETPGETERVTHAVLVKMRAIIGEAKGLK